MKRQVRIMSSSTVEKQERATTRNTIQRALVLEAVQSLCNHPTSADVYEVVREKHPPISRAPRCIATWAYWRIAAKCCGWRFPTALIAMISATSPITMRSAACAAAYSTSRCRILTTWPPRCKTLMALLSRATRSSSTAYAQRVGRRTRTERAACGQEACFARKYRVRR